MTVYNEVKYLMRAIEFSRNSVVGSIFVPIATFAENVTDKLEEYVSMVEGINFPFFGISYSIERVMFNYDPEKE